jgi:hypothetical protein
MFNQSRALAQRLLKETGGDEQAMITKLYKLALGRRPTLAEIRLTRSFLSDQTETIRRRGGEGIVNLKESPRSISKSKAAAWVDLCLAMLNLNEFVYLK